MALLITNNNQYSLTTDEILVSELEFAQSAKDADEIRTESNPENETFVDLENEIVINHDVKSEETFVNVPGEEHISSKSSSFEMINEESDCKNQEEAQTSLKGVDANNEEVQAFIQRVFTESKENFALLSVQESTNIVNMCYTRDKEVKLKETQEESPEMPSSVELIWQSDTKTKRMSPDDTQHERSLQSREDAVSMSASSYYSNEISKGGPNDDNTLSILKKPAECSDSYARMTFDLSHDEAGERRSVTIDESGVVIIDLPGGMYEFSTEDDEAFQEIELEDDNNTDSKPNYPDGGWGWVIAFAAFLHNIIIIGSHNVFGLLFVDLVKEFNESLFKTSLIGSIAFGCILLFAPIAGVLSNRYGCRRVTVAGVLLAAVSALVSSYASSIDTMFFTYGVCFGFGTSLSYMQGIVMISRYFSTRRALATGIVFSGSSFGTLIMASIYNELSAAFGWRVALRVLAGIIFIVILSGLSYRPLSNPSPASIEERMKTSPARRLVLDLSLWKNKAFIVWTVSVGLFKLGYLVPFVHLVKHAEDIGMSRDFGPTLLGLIGVTSGVSRLISGRIADSPKVNRLYLSQGSAFFMGLINILLPSINNNIGIISYAVISGILDGGMEILLSVMTLDLVGPEKMTIAWGVLLAVISASGFGPPIAGAIRDNEGNYSGAFYFAGIPMVLAALVLILIPTWAQKQTQQPATSFLSIDPSKLEVTPRKMDEQGAGTSSFAGNESDGKEKSNNRVRRFFKLSQQRARSEFTLIWRRIPTMRNTTAINDKQLLDDSSSNQMSDRV